MHEFDRRSRVPWFTRWYEGTLHGVGQDLAISTQDAYVDIRTVNEFLNDELARVVQAGSEFDDLLSISAEVEALPS
jgi:hypothetical protein